MASSDDEGEELPRFVSDYHFVDENDEPISFSVLPFQWSPDEISGGKKKQLFVHGTTDDGLQKIYKPVKAWKFNLSHMIPEISVLSKENNWIKLQKPKKSFESIIRTTLITVNCLHIMKKNPETSEKSLWDQLSKNFSLLEPRPSMNDLIDDMELVEEAFRRDHSLSKSKFIVTFLEEKPQKKKVVDEDGSQHTMRRFIIDDDGASDDDSDEDQLFDSVCAICDNGGRIIPCDGVCMRSFHTTREDAIKDAKEDKIKRDSICSSLGYSKKEIRATPTFTCRNCLHKQHQCFSCGQLGSSDKTSVVAEVFQCVSATCGYFYHPGCVAKLLHPDDPAAAEELEKNVATGVPFACPSHNCYVCKQLENHMVDELQFAVCRRCPTSYHRKCLPREISFEDTEDSEQRAWENLLRINNRILIYCPKHEIDPNLGTPIRDHLKFPGVASEKQKPSSALLLRKNKIAIDKKSLVPGMRRLKKVVTDASIAKSEKSVQTSLACKRKPDGTDASSKQQTKKITTKRRAIGSSSIGEDKGSFGEQLWEKYRKQSDSNNQGKFVSDDESQKSKFVSEDESRKSVKTVSRQSDSLMEELDPASKERIENLIKEAESSITSDSIYEKYNKLLSTHAHSHKTSLESFTQGRVEGLVQAIQTALKKLDEGCDIEEAKAVCGPNVLNQIFKWKNKLRVYIAPFLYGMRYTSFGRHFTKVEKLKEIVDKIHWYVEDGDTVVDFCCGANDFSCLMKERLEETGKKCSYRNFDLFRPKNDFCFERRDWMTVQPTELPKGSKLVMGLNPPFGVKASLANKFIDKALEFKPKLIILVVPPETERLDKKKPPYDLVWEDFEKLSGRSFYLPGSVDINDKQMEDWNVIAPVLYLWSRRDWTSKFREIAEKRGHLCGKQSLERHNEREVSNQSTKVNAQASSDKEIDDEPAQDKKLEELILKVEADIKDHVEESAKDDINEDSRVINGSGGSQSQKNSRRKRCRGKKHQTGKDETPVVGDDHKIHGSSSAEPFHKRTHYSPANDMVFGRSPLDDPLLATEKQPLAWESAEIGFNHFEGQPGFEYAPGHLKGPSSYPEHNFPRRFGIENDNPHLSGLYGFSSSMSYPLDRTPDYMRQSEGFGQRAYTRELELRYGIPPPSFGSELPPYGSMGMPMVERYAPRLDELNQGRIGDLGLPDLPRPGYSRVYDYLPPSSSIQGPPMGFAPGPHRSSSHQSSGGWIDD